jgi:hypothetical protein
MGRSHSINQRCRCFVAPADAGSFQNVILKGHAFGIVFRKPGFCGVLVGEDLARMPRSPTGTNTGTFATHTHRTAPNQDNSELQGDVKTKMGGRHVGIIEWLLVWLIVNALYVVWRILVTTEVETRDRSIRKMPNVADL